MTRLLVLLSCLAVVGCRGGDPEATPPADGVSPAEAVSPVEVATADAPRSAEPDASDAEPGLPEVHGRLTNVGGQKVLHVWGTPREMGHAHGALLRDGIIEVFDQYALKVIPPATVASAGVVYGTVADVPQVLRDEAEGIIAGMKQAGGAEVSGLGRSLTANDLLLINAMTDLLSVGCSSVSAWGQSTAQDAELNGNAVVVRNLDWSDDDALLRNQVLIAFEPSDPTRQPVLSVAFAGYIGCLSCINEAGVTALFNMGYGDGAAELGELMGGFAPANLLLRDTMERRDVDLDGVSSAADVEAALRAKKHAGSYILHVLEPAKLARTLDRAPARILEVEADGVVARSPIQSDALGGNALAATNHLRGKEGPQACSRYSRIERSATRSKQSFNRDGLWALGRSVRLGSVVHTMLVEPDVRRLTLWLRQPDESQQSKREPVVHTWDSVLRRTLNPR